MAALRKHKDTLEDYFELERTSDIKHEYVNGEIVAMAGAKRKHNLICASLGASLYSIAQKKGCETYPSDMRLGTPTGLYAYPDGMVMCGKAEISTFKGLETLHNPILIVEVLSPSTEDFDRGAKFRHYRSIPSLQVYLLIDQDVPHVEMHTRQSDDSWLLRDTIGLDSEIHIEPLNATLRLRDIYAQIDFDEQDQLND
jgi:Uma2 family endonuclease